jgi:hypothetical protein
MRGTFLPRSGPAFAWAAALACATVAGTAILSCMMPFVAVATILAATLPARKGAATMVAIWFGNQLLGFSVMGFPATAYTLAWGGALLAASLAAMAVARMTIVDRHELVATRVATGFAIAFLAYEGLLYAFASLVGGIETFAPSIVIQIAFNDTLWLLFLLGLHLILTRTAPAWFGMAARLRFVA